MANNPEASTQVIIPETSPSMRQRVLALVGAGALLAGATACGSDEKVSAIPSPVETSTSQSANPTEAPTEESTTPAETNSPSPISRETAPSAAHETKTVPMGLSYEESVEIYNNQLNDMQQKFFKTVDPEYIGNLQSLEEVTDVCRIPIEEVSTVDPITGQLEIDAEAAVISARMRSALALGAAVSPATLKKQGLSGDPSDTLSTPRETLNDIGFDYWRACMRGVNPNYEISENHDQAAASGYAIIRQATMDFVAKYKDLEFSPYRHVSMPAAFGEPVVDGDTISIPGTFFTLDNFPEEEVSRVIGSDDPNAKAMKSEGESIISYINTDGMHVTVGEKSASTK